MKQSCLIEFLHVEKLVFTDIHQSLVNADGDQGVDVSIVRWQVVHFRSGNSNVNHGYVIIMVMTCMLLFITGENEYLMVMALLKNSIL